jgi:predicted lactoylglutathione lyase
MTTSQAPNPTIRNAGTKPATSRKLFVNLPVSDLQRSIDFFETLGFTFNTQFTDATATCMLVGEDAYFMLLTPEKFRSFSRRPTADARKETGVLIAISAESRSEVDRLADQALAAGGSPATDAQDHGFMYARTFYDLDGHHWEVFWMDPAVVQG